ncbi:CoA transferase, partial [Micrococcus endophyticus]
LTRVIAGAGRLAAHGVPRADVLRIDPPARPEIDAQFLSNGMGKRSATADLAEHRTELEALLAGADVVLLGYRPGSLDRFGL